MKSEAHDIARFSFSRGQELLVDTNVWIFIYGPHKPGSGQARAYSSALGRILSAQCCVYIDVVILSEFVNRCARLWHQLTDRSTRFEDFRASTAFAYVAGYIVDDIRRILEHCKRLETGFEALDIDRVLDGFDRGTSDFNDLVLAELCRGRGLTLVTDDAGFADSGLRIVTANGRLLA